jgi:hypothetical protein
MSTSATGMVVLTIKLDQERWRGALSSAYLRLAKLLEVWVHFTGIPKKVAVSWVEEVDYRDTVPPQLRDRLKETEHSSVLNFCNVRFILKNIPEEFSQFYDAVDDAICVGEQNHNEFVVGAVVGKHCSGLSVKSNPPTLLSCDNINAESDSAETQSPAKNVKSPATPDAERENESKSKNVSPNNDDSTFVSVLPASNFKASKVVTDVTNDNPEDSNEATVKQESTANQDLPARVTVHSMASLKKVRTLCSQKTAGLVGTRRTEGWGAHPSRTLIIVIVIVMMRDTVTLK